MVRTCRSPRGQCSIIVREILLTRSEWRVMTSYPFIIYYSNFNKSKIHNYKHCLVWTKLHITLRVELIVVDIYHPHTVAKAHQFQFTLTFTFNIQLTYLVKCKSNNTFFSFSLLIIILIEFHRHKTIHFLISSVKY